jgi:hypothetical protein
LIRCILWEIGNGHFRHVGGRDDAARGESQDGASQRDAASQPAHSEESIRLAKELTPKQRIVLQALSEGCGPPEAARRAKVDPSTVNRWLNHNARFIAAHNAWITETIKAGRAAVVSLIPLAATAVREAIETGNGWLALQLLRDAKLTTPPDAAAITPKAARQQLKVEKQKRDAELVQKELQIKLQQQEIEKLQARVKSYEDEKRFEKEQNMAYFDAWAAFWSQWKDEKQWQEHHAQWRKEQFDKELEQIQRQREIKQLKESAGRPAKRIKVSCEEWKPRLEQQRRDSEADAELLKAIKADPDGIAATAVKLPPGVQWPKGWPNVRESESNESGESAGPEAARQPEASGQSSDWKPHPDSGRPASNASATATSDG